LQTRFDDYRAVRIDPDAAHLLRGHTRRVDVHADADPTTQPPAVAVGAACREALPVCAGERGLEHTREIAAVVDDTIRSLIRHCQRRDQVPAAQLNRIRSQRAGRSLDQPFQKIY
jgi:hypothetical protein